MRLNWTVIASVLLSCSLHWTRNNNGKTKKEKENLIPFWFTINKKKKKIGFSLVFCLEFCTNYFNRFLFLLFFFFLGKTIAYGYAFIYATRFVPLIPTKLHWMRRQNGSAYDCDWAETFFTEKKKKING